MTLTVKYDRIDFFGNREYTEDTAAICDKKNLMKAFAFLSKDKEAAVELYNGETLILYWDTYNDFENRVITLTHSRSWNDSDITKVAFEKAKKLIYQKIGG